MTFGLGKFEQGGGVDGMELFGLGEQELRDQAGSVEDPDVRRVMESVIKVLEEITKQTASATKMS